MNKKTIISSLVIAAVLVGLAMYASQKTNNKAIEQPPTAVAPQPTKTPSAVEADLNAIDAEGFEADINNINTDISGL